MVHLAYVKIRNPKAEYTQFYIGEKYRVEILQRLISINLLF